MSSVSILHTCTYQYYMSDINMRFCLMVQHRYTWFLFMTFLHAYIPLGYMVIHQTNTIPPYISLGYTSYKKKLTSWDIHVYAHPESTVYKEASHSHHQIISPLAVLGVGHIQTVLGEGGIARESSQPQHITFLILFWKSFSEEMPVSFFTLLYFIMMREKKDRCNRCIYIYIHNKLA